MSGGESESVKADYTVGVINNTSSLPITEYTDWTKYTGTATYTGTANTSTFYTWPQNHYFYQITCPKCKTNNWLELDTLVDCTKCRSKLKAVANKADYEIPVNV